MNPELAALLQELGISEEDFAAMSEAGMLDGTGLSPDDRSAISEAGVYNQRSDLEKRKTDFWQGQFDKPTQGDRMVGGYYVPRSNMGLLADLGNKGISAYMMSQGMGGEAGLIEGLKKGQTVVGEAGARDRLGEQGDQSKLELLIELLRSGG